MSADRPQPLVQISGKALGSELGLRTGPEGGRGRDYRHLKRIMLNSHCGRVKPFAPNVNSS